MTDDTPGKIIDVAIDRLEEALDVLHVLRGLPDVQRWERRLGCRTTSHVRDVRDADSVYRAPLAEV